MVEQNLKKAKESYESYKRTESYKHKNLYLLEALYHQNNEIIKLLIKKKE